MKLIPIVTTIFAASAPFLGGVPAHAQAPPRVVHVQAWIDGRSQLILTGATAQWQHFDFAAPGRLNCDTGSPSEPTNLDFIAWNPVWPDVPSCENRFCGGCFSDVYSGISPPLPATEFRPSVVPWSIRGDVSIVDLPSSTNGFQTVIEFNDNSYGGADWYEFDLNIQTCFSQTYCSSTPNSSGNPAWIAANGDLTVNGKTTLVAFGCPADKPGMFFYGRGWANIPLANGRLCIDPFSGVYRIPQFARTDPNGDAQITLDYSQLPAVAAILPDSTWYFQYWFRDPLGPGGGPGSNLTDAVQVHFCP